MAVTFGTSARLDMAISSILNNAPNVEVAITGPTETMRLRSIILTNGKDSSERIHVYEFADEMSVHFGSGLSMDFNSTPGDVDEIENLLRSLIFQGFTETIWIRGGNVVSAEAAIDCSSGVQRVKRTTLLGRLRATSHLQHHEAWQ